MSKPYSLSAGIIALGLFCGSAMAEPSASPVSATGLEGVILVAPAHPGPVREGISASAPLAHTDFIVQKANETVASFTTDEKGAFRISLLPGHYSVSRKAAARTIGHFGPFEADVVDGEITKVNWTCDSGMR
jgi:hypothetical protein